MDTVVVIPNENILKIAPDLPIGSAFQVVDEVLTTTIRGISELITEPGLINLDFADVRSVLEADGMAKMGVGEGSGENKFMEAAENVIESPLLDADLSAANKALMSIKGDPEMKLEGAQSITEEISTHLRADANVIWG